MDRRTLLLSDAFESFTSCQYAAIELPRGDLLVVEAPLIKVKGKYSREVNPRVVPNRAGKIGTAVIMHVKGYGPGRMLFQVTKLGCETVEANWSGRCPDLAPPTPKKFVDQLCRQTGMDIRTNDQMLWSLYRELSVREFNSMTAMANDLVETAMQSMKPQPMALETVEEEVNVPSHAGSMHVTHHSGRANQNRELSQREAMVAGIIQ